MRLFIEWVTRLTGQSVPFEEKGNTLPERSPFDNGGIGHSQFNELLLWLGYDRVSDGFFRYVFGDARSIGSFTRFRSGIRAYRKNVMRKYGNFKHAFKTLYSKTFEEIKEEFVEFEPIGLEHFESRHSPLAAIQEVPREDAPYLGYLVQAELASKREKAKSEKEKNI